MNIRLLLLGMAVALLPGCAGYWSKPLKRLDPKQFIRQSNGKVLFSYKTFSKKDCERYLGKDVIKAGYQPVQISIINQTDHYVRFSPHRITLKTVPADVVAKRVYDSTASRFIGWGIASIFLPTLFIPAIVDSAWSYEANEQLDEDYAAKAGQEQLIGPGSEINGLIFVEVEDYKSSFTVTLIDEDTREQIICSTY
jgi:hypothetical protein